jgi:hypothetical protein
MTDGDGDKVQRLPVRFKSPLPPGRTLLLPYEVGQRPCFHERFVVDGDKAEVECADCKEKLNPMWVLSRLAQRDHRFHEAHHRYHEQMKRLDERSRTKCRYCGKMTPISRR